MSKCLRVYQYPIFVQFEDVDAGGVVYHANYINYLERARSQMLREQGYPFKQMLAEGYAVVVAEMHCQFKRPARLEETLYVLTQGMASRRSSLKVIQLILNRPPTERELTGELSKLCNESETASALIHNAQFRLVCVKLESLKVAEFPKNFVSALELPAPSDQVRLGVVDAAVL